MGLRITDLPPEYQRQALEKYATVNGPGEKVKRKYHNVKTEVGKMTFDSKKEAERFQTLYIMLKAGKIQDLRLQQSFTLIEGFTTPAGEKIRPVKYVADFAYFENGELVVEDVKSAATKQNRTYINKKKMMQEKYGISIKEV